MRLVHSGDRPGRWRDFRCPCGASALLACSIGMPKTPAPKLSDRAILWIVVVGFFLLLSLVSTLMGKNAKDKPAGEPRPDPYETGPEWISRDQQAERDAACIASRIQ